LSMVLSETLLDKIRSQKSKMEAEKCSYTFENVIATKF
jgi:hypothetical protein